MLPLPASWLLWHLTAILLAIIFSGLPQAWRGICNDYLMLAADPALGSWIEGLVAYPGFWALFWYRLSHVLWQRGIPMISTLVPRLVMSIVRYCTAVDIHPAAKLSDGGLLLDHATGIVIGATAEVGGGTTIYHQVTLGSTGKHVPKGEKRHPTVGAHCVIGAGAKILGPIVVGDHCAVGANSVVTKPVPKRTTVVGIPARAVGREKNMYRADPESEALYNLHARLMLLESRIANCTNGGATPVTKTPSNGEAGAGSDTGSSGTTSSEDSEPSSRPHSPPPAVICEELMAKLRGLEGGEENRVSLERYWSRLACDKRLCFSSLNSVLAEGLEYSPEADSSLSSSML